MLRGSAATQPGHVLSVATQFPSRCCLQVEQITRKSELRRSSLLGQPLRLDGTEFHSEGSTWFDLSQVDAESMDHLVLPNPLRRP